MTVPVSAPVIRPAQREDCARMFELIAELAAYEREPDAVTVEFDHFVAAGFGPDPVWWATVGELDGRVEGMALCYERYSTWRGRMVYLEDIVVSERCRQTGIGTLLFNSVRDEAIRRGAAGVCWQVLGWNDPAIAFYRRYTTEFDGDWVNCRLML
jgi:GNAT superfamily N-acetyltransferase